MSAIASSPFNQALARIAATPAPPRVRQLLEGTLQVAIEVLRTPLQLTMVDLERALFQQAERARSGHSEADVHAQVRALRERAEDFPSYFFDALATHLAAFKEPPRPSEEIHAATLKNMTLVTDTDIDRDIVLHEMARRESNRSLSVLQLHGLRFGVLAAQPAFDVERLPYGPYGLCRALRDAGERLQLSLETQLLLYQVFERQVMERHTELGDRLNQMLSREGVLPGLVYRPYLVRPSAPRGHGPNAGPGHSAGGDGGAPHPAGQAPLTSWQGQGPATSWAGLSEVLQGLAPTAGATSVAAPMAPTAAAGAGGNSTMEGLHSLLDAARQVLSQGIAALPAGTVGAAAQGGGLPTVDAATAAALQAYIAAHPAFTAPAGAPAPSQPAVARQPVPSQTVMNMLGKLQGSATPASGRRNFNDIHNALLSQLKAEHGEAATLSPQDGDALDLLGMLYSQIQHEVRSEAPAANLLAKLQVPLARAAIKDPGFFQRDQHPARDLLNAVAESGATWLSEEDSDPLLQLKLKDAVNKVVTDYQGDESVFAEANQTIQNHLQAAARRAEMAERRQVDAARGKEKLEAAKQLARNTIDDLCRNDEPPRFVQTLLHKAWSDVLTLTLLRHGQDSAEWQQREEATHRISELTRQAPGGAGDSAFAEQLEESLLQVGYHHDDASAIARRLSTPGGEDDITSRTELTARLRARARLGEAGDRDEDEEQPERPTAERSAAEESCYRQLRTMPFGTWFEFIINQQGDSRRQRLSWYSLITDNALFVNQRGQKVAEHQLDALARLMAQGQLRVVTEDRGRLIDRAWMAALRTLRAIAGNGTNAAESA